MTINLGLVTTLALEAETAKETLTDEDTTAYVEDVTLHVGDTQVRFSASREALDALLSSVASYAALPHSLETAPVARCYPAKREGEWILPYPYDSVHFTEGRSGNTHVYVNGMAPNSYNPTNLAEAAGVCPKAHSDQHGVLAAVIAAQVHEVCETLKYNGVRVIDPHPSSLPRDIALADLTAQLASEVARKLLEFQDDPDDWEDPSQSSAF